MSNKLSFLFSTEAIQPSLAADLFDRGFALVQLSLIHMHTNAIFMITTLIKPPD